MKITSGLTATLAGTLALYAAPAALHAQSIGVNCSTGSAATTLSPTAPAGVSPFTQTNYNNVSTTPTNLVLKDGTGSATTTTLTLTGGSSFISFGRTPAEADEALNSGAAFNNGGTLTFTLTNIPYAAYRLIVYDLALFPNTVQRVTDGAVSFFTSSPDPTAAGYLDGNAATPFTYTPGTSLLQAAPTANADYVLFPALTGASQTFTVSNVNGASFATVTGFQIINAVPEPSTYALALLGGAGLLGIVRRSRVARRRV